MMNPEPRAESPLPMKSGAIAEGGISESCRRVGGEQQYDKNDETRLSCELLGCGMPKCLEKHECGVQKWERNKYKRDEVELLAEDT